MSKQLTISSAISMLAVTAFVLFASPNNAPDHTLSHDQTATGAKAHASAPAVDQSRS